MIRNSKSFTADQVDTILEHLDDGEFPLYCAAMLATHTGMRMSEIATLRWCDLHLASKMVSVPTGKTNRPILVPLPRRLVECLQHLRAFEADDELVFNYPYNRLVLRVNRVLRLACKKLKLAAIKVHTLRASFLTRLSHHGVPTYALTQVRAYCQMLAHRKNCFKNK
jgi:integrase